MKAVVVPGRVFAAAAVLLGGLIEKVRSIFLCWAGLISWRITAIRFSIKVRFAVAVGLAVHTLLPYLERVGL